MSFNKTELLNFMLVDLYKSNLVLVENEQNITKKAALTKKETVDEEMILVSEHLTSNPIIAADAPLVYLGNNKKNISIIVHDTTSIHLQDDLLEILSAILTACKLNLADVAIVNAYTQVVNNSKLRSELSPKTVLLFGVQTNAINLPFSIPDYKLQAFDNCTYIQSASLEKMRPSQPEAKLEKSKLWVCLKNLFGV